MEYLLWESFGIGFFMVSPGERPELGESHARWELSCTITTSNFAPFMTSVNNSLFCHLQARH
jgi:hypothetical protein